MRPGIEEERSNEIDEWHDEYEAKNRLLDAPGDLDRIPGLDVSGLWNFTPKPGRFVAVPGHPNVKCWMYDGEPAVFPARYRDASREDVAYD
jgi:hypothetical protein